MTELTIGYARVLTIDQDLTVQRKALAALGVETDPDCAKRSPPAAAATRSW